MKSLIILTAILFSTNALAYREGTISCKNARAELPNNIYKIETVQVGSSSLPYIEVTRHYKLADGVQVATVRGLASVHSSKPNSELLQLGNVNLQFENGELFGCKP